MNTGSSVDGKYYVRDCCMCEKGHSQCPTLSKTAYMFFLRIDTGGCSVICATPVFFMILLICTHQLISNYLLS